jgi:hypothetical protein
LPDRSKSFCATVHPWFVWSKVAQALSTRPAKGVTFAGLVEVYTIT